MFEIPARRKEFEQLCECLRQKASSLPPGPLDPPDLVFLKAENNFCHRDLLLVIGKEDVEGVSEGARELSEEVELEN